MVVKIVTDSASDVPPEVARQLDITLVPHIVRFGDETYLNGANLTSEEFYEKLTSSKVPPSTSVPPPASFAEVYDRLAESTGHIIVIAVSSRLTGTHNVAVQAVKLMKKACHVEVIDSGWAIMAEGLIAIAAAKAANAGAGFDEVMALVKRNKGRVDFRATFDTLEYLRRGGRIGRARAMLGSMLKVNPVIGLRNGEAVPFGRERSRSRAINHLYDFAAAYKNLEEMAVEEAATHNDADMLVERLSAIFAKERIIRAKASPTVGTHTGPSLLVVSVLGDK